MSNFSFSHRVFKRLVLQTPENQGLFGKGWKVQIMICVLDKLENIVGKEIKCWLPAFSAFTTLLSKAFLFKVIKIQGCVVAL